MPLDRSPEVGPEVVLPGRAGGLGTFAGVYTPSILTILGVIMYLRLGWVVGQVGLVGTLLIVTLATSITFLTALSIAAIATDQQVRTGGAYYMISRSLGIETGGAVGIPLYFALALSVALYTVGFAESVVRVFPHLDQRLIGLLTTVAIAALALRSAATAIRSQYVIMAAIGLSLVSLALGGAVEPLPETTAAGPPELFDFWTVFAVFFPAVTGIMAGVSMSGDLRQPGRAIPRGTLAAVGTGYAIYMALPMILAARADRLTLLAEPLVMRRIAQWDELIVLGVWGATLSSALGSLLGAPRVLQALARDRVLPRPLRGLGRGSGPQDEPRRGTVVTLGVALVAVALGDLDVIAPVLTMFFLTTYGVLNVAAGVERFLGSPSFRPQFRVHWAFSALGAVGCVAVMMLINPLATAVAALVVGGIFFWLERRELTTAWGDVRRGLWTALVRAGLLRLRGETDSKNWRPHPLVLSGAPTRRWHLIELADALTHQRGLVTVATVLPAEHVDASRSRAMEETIQDYLERRGVEALVRVVTAPDPFTGGERLIAAYGLGNLVPNTIVLGDSERPELRERYCAMLRTVHRARRNIVVVHGGDDERGFGARRRIDVWWGGLQLNGGLMMILAYLLSASLRWRRAEVVLKLVVANESARSGVRRNLEQLIAQARIAGRVEVIIADGRPFGDIFRRASHDADLVMMGIATPGDDFAGYYEKLQRRVAGMPPTLFVLAAEPVAFGEILV